MAEESLRISIEARDNASATFDNVRRQMELFPDVARRMSQNVEQTNRSFDGLDLSASKATRGVRGLVVPLVSELSPALGQTTSRIGQVVTSAILLGSGFGALGLAAAGVAGIIGGQLYESWNKAREAAEKFNRALVSGDLPRVTTQMAAQREELEKANIALEKRLALLNAMDPRRASQLIGPLSPGARAAAAETERQRIVGELARGATIADALRGRGETEGELGVAGITEQGERADQAARRRLRGAADFDLDPIQARYRQALREISDLRLDQGLDVGLAGQLRGVAARERDEALRLRGAAALGRDAVEPGQGFEASIAGATDEVTRMAIEAKQAKAAIDDLRESLERDVGGGQMETALAGLTPEDRVRGAALVTKELEDQLQKTQLIAMWNAQSVDLGLQQREALALQAIEEEKILKLKIAGTDEAKRLAAEVDAALKRQRVLEATDATAGFRRGLTDVEVEFGSAGLRMQSLAHEMGGGMARALDDSFFDVVTGNFKDLPDVARRFTQDMVRAVTGELSKLLTSQIVGQVKNLFGGDTVGSLPFGLGSGGAPLLTAAGRPLSESEIATAYAAGGEAGVRALRAGEATVVGGEFVATGGGLEQVSAGAGIRTTAAPSGFTWRQGAGIAGSAALLGLTAYGARGAQTNFDVGTSAALGALSGATLGGQVGGAFGYQGAGTAVGAVLGAAINGTIAALAKQEADKEARKARQAAELERAAGAGSDLVRSAAGATSVSDLFRRITAAGSGYTGGTANPAVSTTVQTPTGPRPIGIENATYPVATLQDLLANPQSLQANIQAGVDPSALAGPNAATSEALRAIAGDLVDQFREAEMGVGLTQEDRLGGLTRRTTYPASRADMLDPTRGVEIDELALQALSDDDRAVLLLDVMGRVAVEQDIQSTISDGATGQIVSITRIARSTIPLPPSAPPAPGVPPEAVPPIQQAAALNIPRFTEALPKGTAIQQPVQEWQQTGEGGLYVDTGQMQTVGYAAPSAEQLAAYNARREEFYRPYVEQLGTTAKAQLAALTLPEIQAAMNAGLLSPALVASLAQAGLLPQVRAALPPELQQALDEAASPGGGGGVADPGLPTGFPGVPAIFGSPNVGEALGAGVVAALANAVPLTSFGLPNTLSGVQQAAVTLFGALGTISGIPGLGTALAAALGVSNNYAAQLAAAQLATASNLGTMTAAEAAAVLSSDPTVTGTAAVAAAIASGQSFVSLTAAEAAAVAPFSSYATPTGYVGYVGHVAGSPTGYVGDIPDSSNFFGEAGSPTGSVSPTTGLGITGDPQGEGVTSSDPSDAGVGGGGGGGK